MQKWRQRYGRMERCLPRRGGYMSDTPRQRQADRLLARALTRLQVLDQRTMPKVNLKLEAIRLPTTFAVTLPSMWRTPRRGGNHAL
jgi:hypothetical protein